MVWPGVKGQGLKSSWSTRGLIRVRCESASVSSWLSRYVTLPREYSQTAATYTQNVVLCVCWHSRVSAHICASVRACICVQRGFLFYLIAFSEQELRQVGTILKKHKTTPVKTCQITLQRQRVWFTHPHQITATQPKHDKTFTAHFGWINFITTFKWLQDEKMFDVLEHLLFPLQTPEIQIQCSY